MTTRNQRLAAVAVGVAGLLGIGLAQGIPNRHSMEDDLYTIRREIIETVLEHAGGRRIDEGVDAFLEDRSAAYGRVQRFMRSLAMEGVTDLSQLTVALRQLRSLVS